MGIRRGQADYGPEGGGRGGGGAGKEKEKTGLCIGSIFGMDVGGTLAKLVYFERLPPGSISPSGGSGFGHRRRDHYHRAAEARAVLAARRAEEEEEEEEEGEGEGGRGDGPRLRRGNSDPRSPPLSAPPSPGHYRGSLRRHPRPCHSAKSEEDLRGLWDLRQASVPDDLEEFAREMHLNEFGGSLGEGGVSPDPTAYRGSSSPLGRSKSMFDLSDRSAEHAEALGRFYDFARRLDAYETGIKDKHLSFHSRYLGGEFHFISFETRRMTNAMDLIRVNNLHLNVMEMGATGGGAHKFADVWDKGLGIKMVKQDELDSLVAGMQFVLADVVGECYTFQPRKSFARRGSCGQEEEQGMGGGEAGTEAEGPTLSSDVTDGDEPSMKLPTTQLTSTASEGSVDAAGARDGNLAETDDDSDYVMGDVYFDDDTWDDGPSLNGDEPPRDCGDEREDESVRYGEGGETGSAEDANLYADTDGARAPPKVDEWWWSRKVQRDVASDAETYPHLLVTIGTGVSILRVDGPRSHERVSGSTIGGGTYWGLCRLLTDVESFEDVLNLAERGDPSKVDMMVGDIYGEGSDALEKLRLPSNIVASSFGKLVAKSDPAAGLKQEDLARALLLMVTNNIGQVAYLNARLNGTRRIYFVGNFLRHNVISQRRLAYAINFWSGGEYEALFLEHEGYFGALGAFLLSQGITHKQGESAEGGSGGGGRTGPNPEVLPRTGSAEGVFRQAESSSAMEIRRKSIPPSFRHYSRSLSS